MMREGLSPLGGIRIVVLNKGGINPGNDISDQDNNWSNDHHYVRDILGHHNFFFLWEIF